MDNDHTPACETRIFPGSGRCTCGEGVERTYDAPAASAISPEQLRYEKIALAMLNDDRSQQMLSPVSWGETIQADKDLWMRRAACAVYHWNNDEVA